MSMNFHRKLPIPQEVKKEFPLTERMIQVKEKRDAGIRAVFDGSSDKFILINEATDYNTPSEYEDFKNKKGDDSIDTARELLRRNGIVL